MRSLLCAAALAVGVSQVPNRPATWQMNQSTIIMPCNYSGFTDPQTLAGFSVIDFDWSNAKQIWAQQKPMNCDALLVQQANMTATAYPGTTVWVYRNSIKALPWFEPVRIKLTDPAYGSWFLNFSGANDYHVPMCDDNYNPPLCSQMYHDQEQTPAYPSGDGDCAAPACDVGTVPVGEYIFNPLAWNTSVRGQTLGQWFIDEYLFGPTGGSNPLVSGFFFDDQWTNDGPTEYEEHAVQDMGLNSTQVAAIAAAYWSNMAEVYAAVLQRGKFSWQQLWTGQGPGAIGTTCPGPRVSNASCATDLRELCNVTSPAQTQTMMYAFSPGRCNMNPAQLPMWQQDLANFLLTRGQYAFLGHGWLGCSQTYAFPDALNADYGEPIDTVCKETSTGSGVFVREWTKATVQMDCNTWTPTITMK